MAFPPQKPRSALSSMPPPPDNEMQDPAPEESPEEPNMPGAPSAPPSDPNLMSLYGDSLAGPSIEDIAHFYENPVVDNPMPFDDFQVPANDQDFYDPVEGPLSGRPSEYGQAGARGQTDYKKQADMADMLAMRAQERKDASQGFQDNVRSLNKKAKGGY